MRFLTCLFNIYWISFTRIDMFWLELQCTFVQCFSTQFAIQRNSIFFPVDKRNCFDWFCLVENMKSFFQVHLDCLRPWPCGKWNCTWFRCHLFYWTSNSLWIIYFLFSVYFIFTILQTNQFSAPIVRVWMQQND